MYGGLRNVHEVAESRVVAKESVAESAPIPVAESIGEIVVVKEFVWLVVSAIAVCRASRTYRQRIKDCGDALNEVLKEFNLKLHSNAVAGLDMECGRIIISLIL